VVGKRGGVPAVSHVWCVMGGIVRSIMILSVHSWSLCSGGNCVGSGGVEVCCS
jgi:hypothetical protein